MDVMFTFDRDSREDQLMVVATQEQWREVVRNLDGIGHAPETMKLLAGLKSWGVTKN